MNTANNAFGNKGDLTAGPVREHLVRLSVPMIWGILSIISFQLADTYFISLLGTDALAAITFTFPVTMAVFYLIMGFGIAMSSVISRLAGQADHDTARRVITHGTIGVFALACLLALTGIAITKPLFMSLGADEIMLALIWQYMPLWFAGTIFVSIPLVDNAAMRAYGDSKTPAFIMLSVAILNVILDPLLIFGLFGLPRLEIQGAALATAISNALACIAALYILTTRKKLLFQGALQLPLFWDSLKRLLYIALPAGLTNMITPFTHGVLIALLAAYGNEAVAAFGIVSRIEAFAFILLMALATGMSPIIGQNWGAGKYERVHSTLNQALGFSALWSLGTAVILGVAAQPLASLFSDNSAVIDTAALYFWVVPVTYILGNLVNGWASAFNAMGMPKRSFMMVVVRMLVMQIPLALIGAELFGIIGIFGAIALTNTLSGGAFHLLNLHVCQQKETPPQTA